MKKKLILICSCLFVIATCCFVVFENTKKDNNNNNNNNNNKILIPNINISLDKILNENNTTVVIKDNIELVTGDKIPTVFELTGQDIDAEIKVYFNDKLLTTDTLEHPGIYTIELIYNNITLTTSITVKDLNPPTLVLNEKTIYYGNNYKVTDFVKSCTDDSNKECKISYKDNNMAKIKKVGTHNIIIIAEDESGNKIEKSTKLTIKKKSNSNSSNKNEDETKNDDNAPEIVNTITETKTNTSTKYGVKITDTIKITYNVYSDGSKVETSRKKTQTSYDYSGYSATTDELKKEAISLTNNNTTKANDVLKYLNNYRSEAGVNSVTLDRTLTIAANIRALELAYSQKFSHERPNGTKYHTAITEIGGSWSYVGENIAGGYTSAKSVSEAWKDSEGHYANMINSNYNKVGIGHVYVDGMDYWVQLFSD